MANGGSKGELLSGIKALALWATVGVLLGVIGFVAAPLVDRSEPKAAQNAQALSTHCAQFIALAKAEYGASWKDQLDPGDSTCATQIGAASTHQTSGGGEPAVATERPAVASYVGRARELVPPPPAPASPAMASGSTTAPAQMTAPTQSAAPAESTAPVDPEAPVARPVIAGGRNPETYCLNVVALAQAKFGETWQLSLTSEEAEACLPNSTIP
jgi:hypothetical protein